MKSMKDVNEKVADAMADLVGQEAFLTWLSTISEAYMDDNNIIIHIDNEFTKSVVVKKYLSFIEELYRKEMQFNNILLKLKKSKDYGNYILDANNIRIIADEAQRAEVDIDKRVECQLKAIAEQIESKARNGEYSANVIMPTETKYEDEIHNRVLNILKTRGYDAAIKNIHKNVYIAEISWM